MLFGLIFITFCPFKSCWLPRFASKYRKEPLNELYRDFCKAYKENTGEDHIGCLIDKTVCTEHGMNFPGCDSNTNKKIIVEAPDVNKSCQYYGLPKYCYFYRDPDTKKRYAYYYPNKYMNWVEEYNRYDYQLKEKKQKTGCKKKILSKTIKKILVQKK